jgi:hypothetical protein
MNAFIFSKEGMLIKLTNGKTRLAFKQHFNIKRCFMSYIKTLPVLNEVAYAVIGSKAMIKFVSLEINNMRKIFGNCGEAPLKEAASANGIKPRRNLEACELCAIIKSRQQKTKIYSTDPEIFKESGYISISDEDNVRVFEEPRSGLSLRMIIQTTVGAIL